MTDDCDDVYDIDPEEVDEPPEEDIVTFPNTIRDEWAVVIKHLNAHIAGTAVNRALWAENHARKTEFQAHNKCLLAIQSIHYQVVFKRSPPLFRVLIVRLWWNEAWISQHLL